ncbi:uncharacterized protein LOC113903034 [Bos indicus x Bos taurus]|uniref:uncharacterized protein LOC113903034 n=1 Tax=Bos indicus x Bos taurus TaxID=30522 RepID=UPI000572B757|nr:uncharacterized protein LOC100847118 isoform X1 [Bos taurus]XP_019827971.1 PREDICTED: uncharacterized protein LOC109567442 isoform X2 [Bos indicus]XP_027414361.1 uncharacterized protein LOC113903034 [Bos indicus x Bos taurus]
MDGWGDQRMLEYLAGQFQLRSTRGREETASAGSIRGFAALGPSSSLNCSSASARQMEGGSCLRVAGNRPASSHVVQFDLQPTFLAPRRKQHGAQGSLRGVPILSRDSWPRRVHCVQRRHGSCHVRSILDRAVLEMLA